jgi:hypothetical protein
VAIDAGTGGTIALRHLEMRHDDHDRSGVRWHAVLDVLGSAEGCRLSCAVTRSVEHALDGWVPVSVFSVPRIVRLVVERGAWSGYQQVQSAPTVVASADSVDELVNGMLLDPSRELPVVVIAPLVEGGFAVEEAALDRLASDLVGMAHVVRIGDPADTYSLSGHLGRALSCFDGAIRIYWPGFATVTDPYQHPLFLRHRVGLRLLAGVRRMVVDHATRRYSAFPEVRGLLDQHRYETAHRLLEEHRARTADLEELVKLVDAANRQLEVARDDLAQQLAAKETEVLDVNRRFQDLESETRRLRWQLQQTKGEANWAQLAEPTREPGTFEEAVLRARSQFTTSLEITDNALKTARVMNSADNSPAKLWAALEALNAVAERWQEDDLPGGLRAAFKSLGWQLGAVSQTAVGQYPHRYGFTHKGSKVGLRSHLDLSRGERIYWYTDKDERRFIVNHIGQHLKDSMTG